jgi:hypothetical protein
MFAYNQVLEGRGMKRSKPARSQTKKIGKDENPLPPVTEDYISSLRGCCKGEDSLVEAASESIVRRASLSDAGTGERDEVH